MNWTELIEEASMELEKERLSIKTSNELEKDQTS